jgi:peptidoglycan-N-acetylglucosamine deacetylase
VSGETSRAREAAQLSRRALIRIAPGLALGAVAAEGAGGPPVTPGSAARPVPIPAPRAPSPAPPPRPPVSPRPVQAKPIRTLAEYRRLVPGPAFPAQAIALTIDDGPHPVWTPRILALLDHYGVPATFFMIGIEARGHGPTARAVVAAGHAVANHTWSHPSTLKRYPPGRMRQQIAMAQDEIYHTTKRTPTLFRSPGGEWSPALFAQAAQAGLVAIDWSDDPRDWSRPGIAPIVNRMLAAKPGQILLCHDGGGDRSQTYTALRTVIPGLLHRGYTFVSL